MVLRNCDCGPVHARDGAQRQSPGACEGHWPSAVVPALKQRGMQWTLEEVARTGLWVSLVAEMAATAVGDRDAALGDLLGRGAGGASAHLSGAGPCGSCTTISSPA